MYAFDDSNRLMTDIAFNLVPDVECETDKSPWYLFNDFLVRRIRKEEVLSFKGTWKVNYPHDIIRDDAHCIRIDTMYIAIPTCG